MDPWILWVYNGVLFANLSSDLAFFWSKEGVCSKRKRGVVKASLVSRNDSLQCLTTKLLGWISIQVGSTTHTSLKLG